MSKNLYAVSNPLDCLISGMEHVLTLLEQGEKVLLFVPNLIETWRVEQALLSRSRREFVKNIDVYNISSFKDIIVSEKYKGLFNKVDRMMLTEHFSEKMTRGLARNLINTVVELKSSYFAPDLLMHLLPYNSSLEIRRLIDTFSEYEKILKEGDFVDDVDATRFALEHSEVLGGYSFVFAGFDVFSNVELDIIGHAVKAGKTVDVFAVDHFSLSMDYIRVLKDAFVSMGFGIKPLEREGENKSVYSLDMMDDEVSFVAKNIADDFLPEKQVGIFVGSKFEQYHALFLYYLNEKLVSTQGAVRLDHSRVLKLVSNILLARAKNYQYKELRTLLLSSLLWTEEDVCNPVDGFLKIFSFLDKRNLFPSGLAGWEKVKTVFKDAVNVDKIISFVKKLEEEIPIYASPRTYAAKLEGFLDEEKIAEVERSSVLNLMHRVSKIIQYKMQPVDFVNKLYSHAEENYIEQGVIELKPVVVAPVRLLSTNVSLSTWLVGICDEWLLQKEPEDFLLSDSAILKLRAHNFIRPLSSELQILKEDTVKRAVGFSDCTYPASMGSILSFLKDKEPISASAGRKTMENVYTETVKEELVIPDFKLQNLSPTSLERYIECPFRYFAANVLRLVEFATDEDTEIPAQTEGQVLHKCLELLLPRALDGELFDLNKEIKRIVTAMEDSLELNPSMLNSILTERVSKILKSVLESEKEFFKFNPDLRLFQREKELCCYLKKEGESSVSLCVEKSGDSCVGFKAKIDRIDVDIKNKWLYVVDYKKRKTPTIKAVIEGRSVQIPLYIMAVAALFPEYRCAGGYYIDLYDNQRKGRIVYAGVSDSVAGPARFRRFNLTVDDEDVSEQISKYVSINGAKAVQGLLQGKFEPCPIDHLECSECEFSGACMKEADFAHTTYNSIGR